RIRHDQFRRLTREYPPLRARHHAGLRRRTRSRRREITGQDFTHRGAEDAQFLGNAKVAISFERLRVLCIPYVPSCVKLNVISRVGDGRFISKAQSPTDLPIANLESY